MGVFLFLICEEIVVCRACVTKVSPNYTYQWNHLSSQRIGEEGGTSNASTSIPHYLSIQGAYWAVWR